MTHLPRLLAAAGALALVGACTSPARGFCEAHADCERDFLGVVIPDLAGDADDSVDVCTVQQDGSVQALRANEEEECQVAAEKLEIFMACIATEFADDNDGCDVLESKCEDERDDVNDALDDIDGNECNSNED
jgi:hypothetical protein